ncbi:MAG: hypothetical protein ACOCQR_01025 [bacterium]
MRVLNCCQCINRELVAKTIKDFFSYSLYPEVKGWAQHEIEELVETGDDYDLLLAFADVPTVVDDMTVEEFIENYNFDFLGIFARKKNGV